MSFSNENCLTSALHSKVSTMKLYDYRSQITVESFVDTERKCYVVQKALINEKHLKIQRQTEDEKRVHKHHSIQMVSVFEMCSNLV